MIHNAHDLLREVRWIRRTGQSLHGLCTAREYRDLARQLIQIVDEGTFLLVHADCPLQNLFGKPWPGDAIEHEFKCAVCARIFKLSADTYHGRASWEPL